MNASLLAAASSGLKLPHIDYTALLPELILIGGAMVLLLVGAMSVRHLRTKWYSLLAGATGVASLVSGIVLWDKIDGGRHSFVAIGGALAIDGFSTAFVILAACVVIVSAFVADGYLRREGVVGPEYHALALLAASGAMFMATANDLIVIFLALEIMSIPLYVLAAMDHRRAESGEAGMKYFILGAFSSAIFVYGIALTYGATGSTNLSQIAGYLANNVSTNEGLLYAGAALVLVGFMFKIAAVPFHMWTPDVYEGSPTAATGYMAAIAKVGGFAALLRVFFLSFHTLVAGWQPILWVVAILTLVLGAVLGLVQRDVKRMLAYSSINHAGFILLGLEAASTTGMSASLYYVFVYAFMVLGSFAVIFVVGRRGDDEHSIESYRGLSRRAPLLAGAFAILLLAQAGAPFTTGFLGKLYVVEAVVDAHSYALAVVAMLSAAVAAAYYLHVVFTMFGNPAPATGPGKADTSAAATAEARQRGRLRLALLGPGIRLGLGGAQPATGELALARFRLAPTGGGVGVVGGVGGSGGAGGAGGEQPTGEAALDDRFELPLSTAIGIAITVAVTLVFGIWPAPLFAFAHSAGLLF